MRIPAATRAIDREDLTVDQVAFEYLLSVTRDRHAAGRVSGYLEAVFEANPGIADHRHFLPLGLVVTLPELAVEAERPAQQRLWD